MTKITTAFFILLFIGCHRRDSHIKEFQQCYPEAQNHSLMQAIQQLDKKIESLFHKSDIENYQMLSDSFFYNPSILESLFSIEEKKMIRLQLQDNDVLDDLVLIKQNGQFQLNNNGNYLKCLQKTSDSKVKTKLEYLNATGWISITLTLSDMSKEMSHDYDDLHWMILKTELLLYTLTNAA